MKNEPKLDIVDNTQNQIFKFNNEFSEQHQKHVYDSIISRIKNASTWCKEEEEPIIPIFPGLLDKGDKGAVIGGSKSGKSYFLLQMALSYCAGLENFLQFEINGKGRVLIVQFEIRKNQFHQRLKNVANGLDLCDRQFEGLDIFNARGEEIHQKCRDGTYFRHPLAILFFIFFEEKK